MKLFKLTLLLSLFSISINATNLTNVGGYYIEPVLEDFCDQSEARFNFNIYGFNNHPSNSFGRIDIVIEITVPEVINFELAEDTSFGLELTDLGNGRHLFSITNLNLLKYDFNKGCFYVKELSTNSQPDMILILGGAKTNVDFSFQMAVKGAYMYGGSSPFEFIGESDEIASVYCYDQNSSRLNLESLEKESKLFPNPVQDQLNISIAEDKNIFIKDTAGRLVWHQKLTQGNHNVDVSDLPRGLYFVVLEGIAQKRETIKLSKL